MKEAARQIDRFRKEHDAFLRMLKNWERAIGLAASNDPGERLEGLRQLYAMQAKLSSMDGHCNDEESPGSVFEKSPDKEMLETLRGEHEVLRRMVSDYNDELHFVCSLPPTAKLVHLGRQVLGRLRHHIAFEEGLLREIEESAKAKQKIPLRPHAQTT